jgi:hypothetical protein
MPGARGTFVAGRYKRKSTDSENQERVAAENRGYRDSPTVTAERLSDDTPRINFFILFSIRATQE